jgi:hypothetical protein
MEPRAEGTWAGRPGDPSTQSANPSISDIDEVMTNLMKDDVGVNDQPMTLFRIELGMLYKSLVGQYRSKSRKVVA